MPHHAGVLPAQHGPQFRCFQPLDRNDPPPPLRPDTADAQAAPALPWPGGIETAASHGLQLDAALQLLSQANLALPPGRADDPVWLQQVVDGLVALSSRDPLTGLANRRAFELSLAREIDRVARSGEPALLLALDIDHFKRVNDVYGHQAGDQVIRHVASALLDSVRPMDLVARVGGEEFAIILPNCPNTFGETVAERVRRRVAQMPVAIGLHQQISVTISIGGAYAPQWVRSTGTLWHERADLQLYCAKTQGRNQVQLEATTVSDVSSEEKRLLFGTTSFQDLE